MSEESVTTQETESMKRKNTRWIRFQRRVSTRMEKLLFSETLSCENGRGHRLNGFGIAVVLVLVPFVLLFVIASHPRRFVSALLGLPVPKHDYPNA